jgi:hypothetical protein
MFVKSLGLKADGPKGYEDEKEPLKFPKRGDGKLEEAPGMSHETEGVRAPKREDEQEGVHDLEELQIEFLAAA